RRTMSAAHYSSQSSLSSPSPFFVPSLSSLQLVRVLLPCSHPLTPPFPPFHSPSIFFPSSIFSSIRWP
ncbi:unnamed protein product, partial [Closterium sp. NIES-53]